jgi:hypothetical protein
MKYIPKYIHCVSFLPFHLFWFSRLALTDKVFCRFTPATEEKTFNFLMQLTRVSGPSNSTVF